MILEFFVIPTNHSWNGEAAIFTNSDIKGKKTNNVDVNLGDLEMVILLTSRTEATDWMMKYFILSSAIFDFREFFKIVQKARVLISRATQIKIQEFLRMQAPTETVRAKYMQTAIISRTPNCKFGCYKFAKLFMF